MKVKTGTFCSLARHADWQAWLKIVAPKLLQDLENTINSHKGCRANSNKMMDIYHDLYKTGHGKKFEDFITQRFPWLIEDQTKPTPSQIKKKITTIKKKGYISQPNPTNYNELNKHKVFNFYRPNILSFPQKLILTGDNLFDRVHDFIKNKIGVDYIILDDTAYIEYFEQKHTDVVDKIPRTSRDIYKYRQQHRGSSNNIHKPQ